MTWNLITRLLLDCEPGSVTVRDQSKAGAAMCWEPRGRGRGASCWQIKITLQPREGFEHLMTEPLLRSSRHVKPEQPCGCRTWFSAELPWGCPRPTEATRATLLPGWALVPGGNGKFPSRGSLTPLRLRRNPTASGQGSMALGGTWSWWHPRGRQGTGGCGAGAALGAPRCWHRSSPCCWQRPWGARGLLPCAHPHRGRRGQRWSRASRGRESNCSGD